MNPKKLALLVVPFALLFAASSDAAPVHAQPAPVLPRTTPKPRPMATLQMANVAGVPGEAKSVAATLVGHGGAPLAQKKVEFTISPRSGAAAIPPQAMHVGSGVTDAQGKVSVAWSVPEIPQAGYVLHAHWDGDEEYGGANEAGNLFVAKGITKLEMSDLLWGYKGEELAAFSVQLKRTVDGKALAKPVSVTVLPKGGQAKQWTVNLSGGYEQLPITPLSAPSWKVTVRFNGDDVYLPFEVEKEFVHPK
jgi:hypothetical protein